MGVMRQVPLRALHFRRFARDKQLEPRLPLADS
jgi:hypothetical protein